MKKILLSCCFLLCAASLSAQYVTGKYREGWDRYPPRVQKAGYWLQASQLANMDDDPASEDVLRFGRDLGHYPYFDLFEFYFVVVDHYTKEVEYISDTVVSDQRGIMLEDRNGDGRFELYRNYFKEGRFSVDEKGNNLKAVRCYDCIEWLPGGIGQSSKTVADPLPDVNP